MLESNRDRGTKKWTSIFIPEHVEALKAWYEEDNYVEQPILDDWELQDVQEEIGNAYKRKCDILLKTWDDGKINTYQGIIQEINLQSRVVILDDPFGTERILADEIVSAAIVE